MLLIRKSTFFQKVTVLKDRKSPRKKPVCASKRDVFELATLWYVKNPFGILEQFLHSELWLEKADGIIII